ncbi:MAG: hypothetical protein LBM75_05965 [Myxococcales bacterium]|nr:hypothetical protein [Myxococcales bacterium]
MAEFIDLRLLSDANRLLDQILERRGLRWFLTTEGPRFFELEKSKIDLVVESCLQKQRRAGCEPLPSTVEHCRKQIRRTLIRLLAEAMVATGC